MLALLAKFPICIKILTRQFLPENHGNVRRRLGMGIKESTPNTLASLNFYQCNSTSIIQQAGGQIEKEKNLYTPFTILQPKSAGATFCSQLNVHIKVE